MNLWSKPRREPHDEQSFMRALIAGVYGLN